MVCCIGDFSFMGSLIIEEVIKDLVTFHGLSTASTLFLAGSRYHDIFYYICFSRYNHVAP